MTSPNRAKGITERFPNLGAVLAIAAGVLLLAMTTWPVGGSDRARGDVTAVLTLASRALGFVFAAAPFFVGRSLPFVKGALGAGAVALLALVGLTVASGSAGAATAVDLVVAALAAAAALLIGPRRRPEVERALRAEQQGRMDRARGASAEQPVLGRRAA